MKSNNTQEKKLRAVTGEVSQLDWNEIIPGLNVKVLVVDEERHSVEFLMKADASWKPGLHRHVCETSVLVLDGTISNQNTGREYAPGSFFYQKSGNTHVENMGEQGLYAYVNMRGTCDTLVEFLDDSRTVQGVMNVSHFSSLLPA
ncbi:MAG: hypothetical protein V3T17_15895 [Pseudomonadales bacterium]